MDITNINLFNQCIFKNNFNENSKINKTEQENVKDLAAIYEPSKNINKSDIISMIKIESQNIESQMMNYVQNAIATQGTVFSTANDMWKFLSSGKYEVSDEVKKKAQDAISEDGYWGVEKTAQRIIETAKSLAGNDSEMIDDMYNAFKKGFGEATKSWGKELPDISKRTFDRVGKLFDEWKENVMSIKIDEHI